MSLRKVNRMLVSVASVACAGSSIVFWAICIGAIINVPLLGSGNLVDLLTHYFEPYEFSNNPGAWARFYVGIISFLIPAGIGSLFAGLKAWLLPRNVRLGEAWHMEMSRAYRNTWLLWLSLNGNFRE